MNAVASQVATGTAERYVREWLNAHAASFFITYDATQQRNALAQELGLALGAQAGEARTRAVVTSGGFTRFRTALSTPVNLVYEARP